MNEKLTLGVEGVVMLGVILEALVLFCIVKLEELDVAASVLDVKITTTKHNINIPNRSPSFFCM